MSTNAQRRQALAALADTYMPFKVGDGATYTIGSDSYPMTVRRVSPSGYKVWVSEDDLGPVREVGAHYVSDFISRDVDPSEWRLFTRRVNGKYVISGSRHGRLSRGRYYHMDPHF